MADTDMTAAAATNPTEAPKTESSEVKVESKAATTEATKSEEGEQKWELNGKSEEKNGRRNDREDRNGRFGRNDRNNDRGGRGRGRGRAGFQNNKRHNNEFENLPETDDPAEIRGQVEFYFSTQNLATDEHLFMELDGPNNRPVSINHVCTFKRMRRFQPYTAVVNALRESKDLVVVDDGEFKEPGHEAVKRKDPLVVPAKDSDKERTPTTIDLFYRLKNGSSNDLATSAYVKGFGNEDETGQIALEQFFRPYGSVMVRKRRDDDKNFKGSVFVEFDSEESQKQFLALDPKPKFDDHELVTMGKKEYILMKCEEKGIKPEWELTEQEKYELRQKRREENGGGRGRGGDRGRGGGRGRGRGDRGGRGRGGRGGSDRRDRNRSRSPRRRRDRSASGGSVDSRDWNTRRDRYQKGKDDRGSRKEDKKEPKEIERDAHGVPVVKDSRTEAEIAANNKRKAGDEDRAEDSKKSKLEIKQDE